MNIVYSWTFVGPACVEHVSSLLTQVRYELMQMAKTGEGIFRGKKYTPHLHDALQGAFPPLREVPASVKQSKLQTFVELLEHQTVGIADGETLKSGVLGKDGLQGTVEALQHQRRKVLNATEVKSKFKANQKSTRSFKAADVNLKEEKKAWRLLLRTTPAVQTFLQVVVLHEEVALCEVEEEEAEIAMEDEDEGPQRAFEDRVVEWSTLDSCAHGGLLRGVFNIAQMLNHQFEVCALRFALTHVLDDSGCALP